MAKFAPQAIKDMWPIIDKAFRSDRFSGILEGSADGSGYHHSRSDLIRRGKTRAYSIQHRLDKLGHPDAACAIDISFDNTAELATMTRRLLNAARAKDPRLYMKCREFGGTLDGKTVTAYNVTEQRFISMDKTHLWHGHVSIHRAYSQDSAVCRGIAEVIAGIPANQPPPTGGGGGEKEPEFADGIEELLMTAKWKRYYTNKDQPLIKPGEFQYLRITGADNVSLTAGPARVSGTVAIRAELKPGQSIYLRVVEDDIDANGKGHRRVTYWAQHEIQGSEGGTYAIVPLALIAGAPKKGFKDNLVRVQWHSWDKDAVVTFAEVGRFSTGR